jgi:hypothetical protein
LVDETSVRGGPHEIGKCRADLDRAGFLDKVQALDGHLRQPARCAVFAEDAGVHPKM